MSELNCVFLRLSLLPLCFTQPLKHCESQVPGFQLLIYAAGIVRSILVLVSEHPHRVPKMDCISVFWYANQIRHQQFSPLDWTKYIIRLDIFMQPKPFDNLDHQFGPNLSPNKFSPLFRLANSPGVIHSLTTCRGFDDLAARDLLSPVQLAIDDVLLRKIKRPKADHIRVSPPPAA